MCLISVVVPVRNRWNELRVCLKAIAQQKSCPPCEVIIVDDGSEAPVPDWLTGPIRSYEMPIRLQRQAPLGISAARNRGMSLAAGGLVMFLDSDSIPMESCFASLVACAMNNPDDIAFQFRIQSRVETWAGRMDDLFLTAVQDAALTGNGHILYADTAGFAIRRNYFDQRGMLFDVSVSRGGDTTLMTELLAQGKKPLLVPDAIVYHNHEMSLARYLFKYAASGYKSQRADKSARFRIASERAGKTLRKDILRELAAKSRRRKTGYRTFALLLLASCIKFLGRMAHSLFGPRPGRHKVLNSPVDGVSSCELIARIVQAAETKKGLTATYLNSWTLVAAERDPVFRESLAQFELCFADGIGVVYALLLTRGILIKKVTANDFHIALFQEAANRKLNVALIGASDGVAEAVASRTSGAIPELRILFCSSGYLNTVQEEEAVNELRRLNVHIVLVGRGQPLQELWVQNIRKVLPNVVFLCIGGLFDYVSGRVRPTPLWIRRIGFEWLHRLLNHPRANGYKYVFGIPLLVWYLWKHQWTRVLRWASSAEAD